MGGIDMETSGERAVEYAYREWALDLVDVAMDAYETGATEQKAIDIDKAKRAFYKVCGWLSTYPWFSGVAEEFIKSLEE